MRIISAVIGPGRGKLDFAHEVVYNQFTRPPFRFGRAASDLRVALPIVITCLVGVFCLAPVVIYLTWLAALNRRPQPTVLDGQLDFAALLAGLSGFILFGGGVLVAAVQSNARIVGRGSWEQIRAAWGQEQTAWLATAGGYLIVVIAVATVGFINRRRSVVVFNVDRPTVETAVEDSLAATGLPADRQGNLWRVADNTPVVSLDPAPGLRNVTVRFESADPRIAEELDRGIRFRLANATGADSAAAGWLLAIAVGLLTAVVLCLTLLAVIIYHIV